MNQSDQGLPVMMGSFGFHLSRSMSPSRDTLSRKRGRREVADSSLWMGTHKHKHINKVVLADKAQEHSA